MYLHKNKHIARIYNGTQWKDVPDKPIINGIYYNNSETIHCAGIELMNILTDEEKHAFRKFYDNRQNKQLMGQNKKDIKKILFKERNMIKNTHKIM